MAPPTDLAARPARFELRMSLVFASLFIPLGTHAPYFPLWLEAKGFTVEEIAIILAAPLFLRVVTTPFITSLADRAPERATILTALLLASFVVSLGYFFVSGYVMVLVVSLLLAALWSPQVPVTDSLAVSGVRRFGSDYPSMRIWGSISFLCSSLVMGFVISRAGENTIILLISAGMAFSLLISRVTPRLGPVRNTASASGRVAYRLLGRYFWLCAAGAGVINASHAFMFGFVSIYWKSVGIDPGVFGFLWGWAVVAEIAVFLIFTRVFGAVPPLGVLALAGFVATLRWIAFPLIWPAGLGVGGFFLVQTLHAFSTGLVLIGVQKLIAETVAEEQTGAAQGAAFFFNGLSFSVITLLSGPLYEGFGANGFFFMAAVALGGTFLVLAARRSAPKPGFGR